MRTPSDERLTSVKAGKTHPHPLPQAGGEQQDASPSRKREGLGAGLSEAPPVTDLPTPDPSRKREGGTPERRCILTRQSQGRDGLIRLAVSPDGLVLPDVQAKAPGRGAWIGVDRHALEKALADGALKKALAHAFKTGGLTIPPDLPEQIDRAFQRLLLDRLGLELRAGNLLLGSQRIDKAAREGRVTHLFHAADASADGAAKLDQAWRVGSDAEGSGMAGARLPLDRAALSVAMGRENVVHLALTDEGAGRRVEAIAGRWIAYKRTGPDAAGDGCGADAVEPAGSAEHVIVKD